MAAGPTISIFDSAGSALRFGRENWRFVLAIAGFGAGAQITAAMLLGAIPPLFLLGLSFTTAAVYAALIGASLHGPASVPKRLARDAFNTWLAMGLLGMFLFVVLFALIIVAMSVPLAPYMEALEAAKDDQVRTAEILNQSVNDNPSIWLAFAALAGALMLYVTSRLYVAAPASIEAGRIRVFSTWNWTKNAIWQIIAARLMVLTPAYVLVVTLHMLFAAAMGLGLNNPWSLAPSQALLDAPPILVLLLLFFTAFVQIAVFAVLEAGLAAKIYARLKPPAQP